MKSYKHAEIEAFARQYWGTSHTYKRLNERNASGKPFSFLDGPPYTSGKVHLGTAWNKTLKDMVLRIKRMQGFAVADRAGYDMHGLPTEHAAMKKLGLHTVEDIEKYGVEKFIEACKEWCVTNMLEMTKAFENLGIWMDFENAYQTISPEYINGVWMLLERAHKTGRLYEGLRTMAWDPVFETACAKHELTYETVTDQSIYVKFPITKNGKRTNEYLIIWTTTPWTIPFNLAIMVNPDVEYIKANVDGETWIVAAERAGPFIRELLDKDFTASEPFLGSTIDGFTYEHPFNNRMPYNELKKHHKRIHTVVLSKEYVETTSGTGLVHCAPGCGPEDYEVGIEYGLPAYNTIGSDGSFPAPFEGMKARTDDRKFIALIDEEGALVAKQNYKHEYPHSERSKAPVVYKTTKQWFFKVTDLKDKLIAANDQVLWQPEAGYNAFSSWLNNLRDNSITKQRFWGTPIPIWRNEETGETIIVGSVAELEQLTGKKFREVLSLHKPFIDTTVIPSKKHPGTVLHRIPDVLDVWVDAGSASWNTVNYPSDTTSINTQYPADFILEGKDQIRGWFNLLHLTGFLAFDKPSFKAVYMHGYINDSEGRKMSKSLGNYITPEEVLPTYGIDAFRTYVIGGTSPGLDLNYNKEDIATVAKNMNVLWNTTLYLIDICETGEIIPSLTTTGDEEERYMLSRMERTTKLVNEALETYNLPIIPRLVQELFLELSRSYIQLVREKASGDERQLVADTVYTVVERCLVLLAPVAPFITEVLWQELNTLRAATGSVHEQFWPQANNSLIDEELESAFNELQSIITAGLACREQLKQGVRWPLAQLVVTGVRLPQYESLLKRQVNIKHVQWGSLETKVEILPNYGELGKSFGRDTQKIAKLIIEKQQQPPITIDGHHILSEHVVIKEHAPDGFVSAQFTKGTVYLKQDVSNELVEEGFVRELTRRVQALRKDMNLRKKDTISLCIGSAHHISAHHLEELRKKTNAALVEHHFENKRDEHIKERTYTISAQKTI